MKILYLCPDPGIPVLGHKGAAVHVRELIEAFSLAGHQVTLAAHTLTRAATDERARIKARVIHVPPDPAASAAVSALKEFNERLAVENSWPGELRRLLYNQALYRDLKRRFRNHKPDFIYERASLYATAGARLAEKFNVPHIVELNAPLAVEQSAYWAPGFNQLAASAERWTLLHADAVVVVSAELRKHVLSLGVDRHRIQVMPNGVNTKLFFPGSQAKRPVKPSPFREARKAKGRRPFDSQQHLSPLPGRKKGESSINGGPTLGFVGGLRPWHGVEVLPELLARLSKRHPDARLVIAGDGPLRSELERGFRKRGLLRRVTFTGVLPHHEVPDIIRQFDVALAPYPKLDHDFYFSPLKLFEYMACGVPVVAADLGQIAEVVTRGETGLLHPPGDVKTLLARCEQLLASPTLRRSIGLAAARLVRAKFTWDTNAARVVKLVRRLATRSRK